MSESRRGRRPKRGRAVSELGEGSGRRVRSRVSRRQREITSLGVDQMGSLGVDHLVLPSYVDLGDCDNTCASCGAQFWLAERVVGVSRVGRPKYNQCCKSGTARRPLPEVPPPAFVHYFGEAHFMDNIRAYNSMFAMASFGAKIDTEVNERAGPYVFKVSGQVSHNIGSLFPEVGSPPRFLQMYMYDNEHEVSNRLRFFSNEGRSPLLPEVVAVLSSVLHASHKFVRVFKSARDLSVTLGLDEYAIRLYQHIPDRRYDHPAVGVIGGIICGDDSNASEYDVIVHSRGGGSERVSKLHPSYMPLQYPLLFPHGNEGWSPDLRLQMPNGTVGRRLTTNMFYSFDIHDRHHVYSLILKGGRLFQQFLVDEYTCVEQNRLDFIKLNQEDFRSEYVSGIYDALSQGEVRCRDIGKRIILPASFVGGPRYMHKHYHDALSICRVYGNPDYFITFTCNVKWPEIQRHLLSVGCSRPEDRPDTIARVFHMKVLELVMFFKSDMTFGEVAAYLYTIEFQKRGLPHCHLLLWVTASFKVPDAAAIDAYISAEFPDPLTEALLYKTVTDSMIHGPCGLLGPNCVCMQNGKCSKRFPKAFEEVSRYDKEGCIRYKRKRGSTHMLRSGVVIDAGYVVPYNKRLCSRFAAHINVEYCGWSMMIKYLFKYISKGADRVKFEVKKTSLGLASTSTGASSSASVSDPARCSTSTSRKAPDMIDEISNFQDGRFICPHEASSRILNFDIHDRFPSVQSLAVHLENMQEVRFNENSLIQDVVEEPSFSKTTLTVWFVSNGLYSEGQGLTYIDYPSEFRWIEGEKVWIPRSQGGSFSIGRLAYVHPTAGELFYLRMLLGHKKGSVSFQDLRTVAGNVQPCYRAACELLGLLVNDQEWSIAFAEAAAWATSFELRALFSHLLLFSDIGNPLPLWNSQWKCISDDLLLNLRSLAGNPSLFVNDADLQQQVLLELQRILNAANPPKSLSDFGLPLPSDQVLAVLRNRLLLEETSYDREELTILHSQLLPKLNRNQLQIYEAVKDSFENGTQLLAFVYGHGGTGKTFLWNTIISYFRSFGKIVLAVAASGVASLLLPSGRTAHSRFRIPIEIRPNSNCDIKKNTQLSDLIRQTSFVVWDEAPMSNRLCFESLDRCLRDILDQKEKPFGGLSVLLGGDFRQTLPVKRKGSRMDIIRATLPKSFMWPYFKVFKLELNMRVSQGDLPASSANKIASFCSWLLAVGDGQIGEANLDTSQDTKLIDIPEAYLIGPEEKGLLSLIEFVYGDNILSNPDFHTMSDRSIVCPKNDTADEIKNFILEMIPSPGKTYSSFDSIEPHAQNAAETECLYPPEYVNQLSFPGMPPHDLLLKVNTSVMLLRNINRALGLCNGTRLMITQLLPRIVEAIIITGISIRTRVYIPRIKFVHKGDDMPFDFARKQFPLKVCYTMTINKSQGQSLKKNRNLPAKTSLYPWTIVRRSFKSDITRFVKNFDSL